MIWALLKKVPKYAIVIGVIVASTGAFYVWQFTYSIRQVLNQPGQPPPDNGPKIAFVEAKHEKLLLVDNDLYDLDDGSLIFTNWLKKGMPVKLFWEGESKTVLAQYECGFVRYGLDGNEKQSLWRTYPFGIADDMQSMVFAKERDIWRADIDWKQLALQNERRLTSIEQINEQNFAANVVLATRKTLIIRNMPNLLRVNMETGEVHPTKIPLGDIGKRRSPDNKSVVGIQNGQFYCYDVDSDSAKTIPVGHGAINDYQWLGDDKCLAIAAMKTVIIFDRLKHTLTELTALPSPCFEIGNPSPSNRYVFCIGRTGGVLIDCELKIATAVTGGAGVTWINDSIFIFSRDVPDSAKRGTWTQAVGESEERIFRTPFRRSVEVTNNLRGEIAAILFFDDEIRVLQRSNPISDNCLIQGKFHAVINIPPF